MTIYAYAIGSGASNRKEVIPIATLDLRDSCGVATHLQAVITPHAFYNETFCRVVIVDRGVIDSRLPCTDDYVIFIRAAQNEQLVAAHNTGICCCHEGGRTRHIDGQNICPLLAIKN